MNEFLSTLLQAVIIAAVPICAGAAVKGVRAAVQYLASKSESEIAKKYLTDVADAISTAVTYTSQTYVDSLKNSGEFTKEAQKKAAEKALAACLASISPAAQEFMESVYDDITEYLTTKIEAEVRNQKTGIGHLIA